MTTESICRAIKADVRELKQLAKERQKLLNEVALLEHLESVRKGINNRRN